MKDNYQEIDISIVSEDFSCFGKLKDLNTWQDNFEKVKFIGIFINNEMFLNETAQKIFQNILVNGCEFEKTIKFSSGCYPNLTIDTRDISYQECLDKIDLIILMTKRANEISELINNNMSNGKVKQGSLKKYKSLIQGIKTTYEKGLLLFKMLFKDSEDNRLLFIYYHLIQKKDDIEVRKENFYGLLYYNGEQLVTNNPKILKKNYKK